MKYTIQSKKIPFLLVLSSSAIISSLGYSTWINGEMREKEDPIEVTPSTPVCYIGDVKYLTLDAALDAAYNNGKADTIYVIPNLGFDVTILKSHTLEKGDSLLLPYEGETVLNEEYKSSDNLIGFADNDVTKNRKTHLVLSANQTLTIKGTMTIGAFTGTQSSPMGQASSSYSELEMGMNSTLNVEGNLNCYGFIKEGRSGSTIVVKDGGVLTTPVVFYDHSSASTSNSIKGNGVFPYKQFDVPSVRSKMIFYYGSSMIGRAHLWGSYAGNMIASANLIGKENSFINMVSNDSKIEWQFSDSDTTKTTTTINGHSTSIAYSGIGSFGNLGVEISGVSINSKDYYLPVPVGYSIVIEKNSKFTIPSSIKGVKFMPGSSLLCKENSILTLDSGVLFYQNTTATDKSTFSYPSNVAANFVNDGIVYVNSGFEGLIQTSTSKTTSSSVVFGWYYEPISDCKEGTSSSVYSWAGASGLIKDNDGKVTNGSFESGVGYESVAESDNWSPTKSLDKVDIGKVVIEADKTKSEENKVGTFNLKANLKPNVYGSTNVKYEWSIINGTSGGTFSDTSTAQTILTTEAAGTSTSKTYQVQVAVTFTKIDGTIDTIKSEPLEITALCESCLLPTAVVLMSDGTYKEAGLIRHGDMVIAFNHETGKLEPTQVIVNEHTKADANVCDVLHLIFSNGNTTDLVYMHGYFDLTLNKYVYLSIDNYLEYIGHEFVYVDSKLNRSKVKLVSGEVNRLYTKVVSPVTANHLDIIADNMLSITACVDGLFNIFEYDPTTLAFDKEKMQRDIDKYGLLDYEYFKDYFPKEIYDLLPCKYLGVSIGKGLITWDIIKSYIAKWKDQLMENVK